MLAGSIIALQASFGFSNGLLDGHQRNVALPVTILGAAIAMRGSVKLLRVGLSGLSGSECRLGKYCRDRLHYIFLNVVSELG